jgi:hypothetical protein
MLRLIVALIAALASVAPAHAQSTQAPVRPVATSEVGPWEIVVWSAATRVIQCTLVRAAPRANEPKFGILVDHMGTVLSVDSTAWQLTPRAPVTSTLRPQSGQERTLTAEPVSATRANMMLRRETSLLDQLQSSEHFDVRIGHVTVRVPTEDLNAARVVFDICVQKIGTEWRGPNG